jgi:dihydroxy-acid dehydratase
MGTASTMACITAALGLMPLRGASAPAVSSTRLRIAEETGANAVAVAAARRSPQSILTKESFYNAITVLQAIGGSTNAVVHLMAIVNRHPNLCGSGDITLQTFDDIGRNVPLLIDLKPSGDNYMTNFHNAGGMLAFAAHSSASSSPFGVDNQWCHAGPHRSGHSLTRKRSFDHYRILYIPHRH